MEVGRLQFPSLPERTFHWKITENMSIDEMSCTTKFPKENFCDSNCLAGNPCVEGTLQELFQPEFKIHGSPPGKKNLQEIVFKNNLISVNVPCSLM